MRLSTSICGCDGLHIFLDHFVSAKFVYLLFHYITYSIDSFFCEKYSIDSDSSAWRLWRQTQPLLITDVQLQLVTRIISTMTS
jgi:hypothetical protein